MTQTYEIKAHTQYDPDGARIIYRSLTEAFSADARHLAGQFIDAPAAVVEALARVLAGGPNETVIIETPDVMVDLTPKHIISRHLNSDWDDPNSDM